MQTSVPRWPTTDPGIDGSGRTFGVLAVGAEAGPVSRGWVEAVTARGRPVRAWSGPSAEAALPVLTEWLAQARVGFRLMLAGPEADLLALRAAAAVLLDDELTLLVTDSRERPLWCVHCGATTRTEAGIGAVAGCAGCGRALVVHHHVSRAHGTYLGYQSDAEDR